MFSLPISAGPLIHHIGHSPAGLGSVVMRSYLATRAFAAAWWCAYFNPRWAVVVLRKMSVTDTLARQFYDDR